MVMGNAPAAAVSMRYGFQGPCETVVTACAAGTHSVANAARLIMSGRCTAVIAGSTEAAMTETGVAGFTNMTAMSSSLTSRPFDQRRDGFVMAEGAGVLVLEEYEHAKARGVPIYCELTGYGMSADAHHITAPPEDGDGARRSMIHALKNAKMQPTDIDYVNAHGTSTQLGDIAECVAVKRAFGEHAYKLVVSSTKSMTGHLLGAAGGIEAVFTVLAIRDQVAPPTINLVNVDPQCDLDFAPLIARKMAIRGAMSNSFGFGGTNATLTCRALGCARFTRHRHGADRPEIRRHVGRIDRAHSQRCATRREVRTRRPSTGHRALGNGRRDQPVAGTRPAIVGQSQPARA
jgi:3-oxoacyl-[acyl-carrier-protein] synthase II